LAKAKATGQDIVHSTRFKTRREPKVDAPLGPPPKWMKDKNAIKAWETLVNEVPWLNGSHRALIEITAMLRGQLMAGDKLSVASYNLLRICIGMLGASPVDSSRVSLPPDDDKPEDPSAKYF